MKRLLRTKKILLTMLFAGSIAGMGFGQNVGIGVVTPLEKLHVAGNVRVDPLAGANTRLVGANTLGTLVIVAAGANGQILTQTAGGPAWQTPASDWTILGNAGTNAATNFIGTTDPVDFVVRTSNAERMRVTTGGNVGIATAAPISRLHVDGDVRIGLVLPPNSGVLPSFGPRMIFSGSGAGPSFDTDNSDPLWMARYNAASDNTELRLNLSDNCNAVDAFVIQSGASGCPVTDLFRFDGAGGASKLGGGAWLALSDRRLKSNVRDFSDGLSLVKAVRPVTYEYNGLSNTLANGEVYVGVIAQELQAVAPYMVDSAGQYLTVDPSAFTYILLNAVKEQQAQIEALTTKLEEVSTQLNQLTAPRKGD